VAGGISTLNPRLPMQNSNRLLGLGVLALVVLYLLYLVWPYLIGFLAVVGAVHLYQVWRRRAGS
jgi:hypothetical protein